ncbi:MAG: MFS transporter [Cellulosilyticaceae bacterium]
MLTLLLIIIYAAFISLGLPDAIMGAAWPVMHLDLNVSISNAGVLTFIVSCGTIISSFFSGKLIRRFNTGLITIASIFLTAFALLGIYFSPSFLWLALLSIPLGLGAGSVDAALNNFVSLHYHAKHMNWLHCFWGVGATSGPLIISFFIANQTSWRFGYLIIGLLQFTLALICLFSLPLWRKFELQPETATMQSTSIPLKTLLKLPAALPALTAFFCYCSIELATGLWMSSYLVLCHDVSTSTAAKWTSIFYLGITIGRLIAGFVSTKLSNNQLIRIGVSLILFGVICILLPSSLYFQLIGFISIGLGCAPIYPAMLHDTPNRFGLEFSSSIMGMQMAFAYVGCMLVPPLIGFIGKAFSFWCLPIILILLLVIMYICHERINTLNKRNM